MSNTCIRVDGKGLHVDRITAVLSYPAGFPDPQGHTPCLWDATAFGTFANGRPWSTHGATACRKSDSGETDVFFNPDADFKPGSLVCIKGNIFGRAEGPACETIHP